MADDTRLDRYMEFILKDYTQGLLRYDQYSIENVHPSFFTKFKQGAAKRVVFTGMGCSAIVSDVIRGFFADIGLDLEVFIVNDYDFEFQIPKAVIEDDNTVIIISSYSGFSKEPLLAYRKLERFRDRVLLLTSGGPLAEAGRQDGASIIYWRLRNPDREYPLFHVPEYFAVLLDVFVRFGVLDHNWQGRLQAISSALYVELASRNVEDLSTSIAKACRGANVVLIGSPRWHESLLKLAKMHFNEMAMVPATRNYFHEFCHSEVATLSSPERRHSLIRFIDPTDDDYTTQKGQNLDRLISQKDEDNEMVSVSHIILDQEDFLHQYFFALGVVQKIALKLGQYRRVGSRDLISEAAGNSWYHSSTIQAEAGAA